MKRWDNNMFNKYKKVKGTKYCVMKKNLNFKIIKIVQKQLNLKIKQTIWKRIQLTLRSKKHNVFTEEVNKIALLHWVLTMIKEYKQYIQWKHMHLEQAKIQYVKKKKLSLTI